MNLLNIKNQLNSEGISHIKSFLLDTKEFTSLNKKIKRIVQRFAQKHEIYQKNDSIDEFQKTIVKLNHINPNTGAYINDAINASPELYKLFTSDKIEKLAKEILDINKNDLLSNNYRFRIQIPGTDDISNLPWHQDSHYNSLYNENQSIVIWISLNKIDYEMGPIVYKKGSHKLNKLPKVEWVRPNGAKVFTVENRYIEDSEFEEKTIKTNQGDVLLIDLNLIHRSGFNKSLNKVKISTQARFHNSGANNFLSEYFIS